jgi:hypothetical protein
VGRRGPREASSETDTCARGWTPRAGKRSVEKAPCPRAMRGGSPCGAYPSSETVVRSGVPVLAV